MDAPELKDSNPKTLKTSNSAQMINSSTGKRNPKRRPQKDCFCELDIVERHGRERRSKRHSCDSKQTDLSKKIKDVISRNEEIEQLYKEADSDVSLTSNNETKNHNDRTSTGEFYNTSSNYGTKTRKSRSLSKGTTEKLDANNSEVKAKSFCIKNIEKSKKTYRKHKKEHKTSDGNTNIDSICQNCSGVIENLGSNAYNAQRSIKHKRKHKSKYEKEKTKINSLVSNKYFSKHLLKTDSNLTTKQIITVYKNVNVLAQSDSAASRDAKVKFESVQFNKAPINTVRLADNPKAFSIFGIKRTKLKVRSQSNHDVLQHIKTNDNEINSVIPENKVPAAPGNSFNIKPTALAYFHKFSELSGFSVNKNVHKDKKHKLKKKELNERLPEKKVGRKELSFSNLNLAPVKSFYANLGEELGVITQTSKAEVNQNDDAKSLVKLGIEMKADENRSSCSIKIENIKSSFPFKIEDENQFNENNSLIKTSSTKISDKNKLSSSTKISDRNKLSSSIKIGNENEKLIKMGNENKPDSNNIEKSMQAVSKIKILDKQELQKLSQTALAIRDIIVVTELEKKNASNIMKQNFTKSTKPKFLKNSQPITFNNSGLEDLIAKQNLLDLQNRQEKAKQLFTKNTKFHTNKSIIPNERVVEVSSKLFMDQKVSFTVEAIEPAKRIQLSRSGTSRIAKKKNLKMQVFTGVEINSVDLNFLNHGSGNCKSDEMSIDSLNKPMEALERTNVTSEVETEDLTPANIPIISPRGCRKSKFYYINKDLFKKRNLKIKSKQVLRMKKLSEDNQKYKLTDSATQTINCSNEKVSTDLEISSSTFEKSSLSQTHLNNDKQAGETRIEGKKETNFYNHEFGIPKSTCVAYVNVVTDKISTHNEVRNNATGLINIGSSSKSENNLLLNKHFLKVNKFEQNSSKSRENLYNQENTNKTIAKISNESENSAIKSSNSLKNLKEYLTCDNTLCSKNKCDVKKKRKCIEGKVSKIPILSKSSNVPSRIIKEQSKPNTTVQNQFINELINKICNEKMNIEHNEEELLLLENCLNAIVTTCKKDIERNSNSKEKISRNESKTYKHKIKNLKKTSEHKSANKNSKREKFKKKIHSKSAIKNVYTNCNGFKSSTSSLTSKKSEISTTTTYPVSTPSLQSGFCHNQSHSFEEKSSSSLSDLKHYKNFHKIKRNSNKSKRAKRKQSKQILNDLKNVMKYNAFPSDTYKEDSLTNVVILSVSSTCTLYTTPSNYINKIYRKIIVDNTVVENSIVSKSSVFKNFPKDKRIISKEPFYINQGSSLQDTKDKPSTDSLETQTCATFDLSPLTALFNFCPRSPSYFVYNTEVIIPKNKRQEYKCDAENEHYKQSSEHEELGGKPLTSKTQKLTSFAKISANNVQEKPISTDAMFTNLSEDECDAFLKNNSSCEFSTDEIQRSTNTENKKLTSFAITSSDYSNIIFRDTPKMTSAIPNNDKKDLTTFANTSHVCKNLMFHYIANKSTSHSRTSANNAHSTTSVINSRSTTSVINARSSSVNNTRSTTSIYNAYSSNSVFNADSTTSVINPHSTRIINASLPASVADSFCDLSESCSTIKNSQLGTESGYESSKTSRSSSIKNFFKKGGTLLEIFKKSSVKDSRKKDKSIISLNTNTESAEFQTQSEFNKTVLWFNFGKRKKDVMRCPASCPYKANLPPNQESPVCKKTCHKAALTRKSKGTCTHGRFGKCKCKEEQKDECRKYAEKLLLESTIQNEGNPNFIEPPLDDIIAKDRYFANKCECFAREASCQTPEIEKRKVSEDVSEPKSLEMETSMTSLGKSRSAFPLPSKPFTDEIDENTGKKESELTEKEDEEKKDSRLNDKEVFDKLLDSFEKSNSIAERLSQDHEFFREQVDSIKSGEKKSLPLDSEQDFLVKPKLSGSKYKASHFTDKPFPLQQAKDNDVKADDIGTCFARGFRPDNMMLSGEACFNLNKQDKLKMSPHMLKKTESIIDFSERETPLDFLLALGFMVDEASNALKDDDIRSRLSAAITEARVWINKITTTQGTLLYLVAYKARPESMRYFLQLVEAIINRRIVNAIKLDGFLRVLEQVEDGRLQMINILGESKLEDEENEEKLVKKQLKHLFVNVYSVAEAEAELKKKQLNANQVSLLRNLVSKYRAGLNPHLELIARYIGQGLLDTDVQLEAAMIFLSRLDTAEVKLKEFENYCGITCEDKPGFIKLQ